MKIEHSRPIALDLFAGAGGLSLGMEQAGYDVVAAVEIDPIHAAVHEFNFQRCKTIARSISDLSGSEIRQLAGLTAHTTIDLVAGGAPCQGFSMIGKRCLDDPRNQLVGEFLRVVAELQPNYVLFENVKGITVGKHRTFLDEMLAEFQRIGYEVTPWRVLNAKDYGVPQSRERLFLMAARSGLPLPCYPEALGHVVTCEEALGDLPDADRFPELLRGDSVSFEYLRPAIAYSAAMRGEDWGLGYERFWDKSRITSSWRTEHSAEVVTRFANTPPGSKERVSRFHRLAADGVALTLRAGTDSARGAFTSPRPIHYAYPRCVTVREMARLHGFPDWFRFHGSKWHGARQIGNAVPPPLAYAVSSQFIQAQGLDLEPPIGLATLGPKQLIRMDMAAAAAYFGLEKSPIAARERAA